MFQETIFHSKYACPGKQPTSTSETTISTVESTNGHSTNTPDNPSGLSLGSILLIMYGWINESFFCYYHHYCHKYYHHHHRFLLLILLSLLSLTATFTSNNTIFPRAANLLASNKNLVLCLVPICSPYITDFIAAGFKTKWSSFLLKTTADIHLVCLQLYKITIMKTDHTFQKVPKSISCLSGKRASLTRMSEMCC